MDVANTTLVERIARALAGIDHSANGQGAEHSTSLIVDQSWRGYLPQADAVLRTIREPSERMAAAGDTSLWSTMVEIAIEESEPL
jgi:hypothetical protein